MIFVFQIFHSNTNLHNLNLHGIIVLIDAGKNLAHPFF